MGVPSDKVYITDKVGILTCTKDENDNITTSFKDLYNEVDTIFPPFSSGCRQNAVEKFMDNE